MLKTYCLARPLRLEGILLEAIFGDSYSITFGDCLVVVKRLFLTERSKREF